MNKNLQIIELIEKLKIKCYKTDRFNFDNILMEPYQDQTKEYEVVKTYESDNNKNFYREIPKKGFINLFNYFLDGSRYTYKIADMETVDGEYMPIVAAQVGAAICKRDDETRVLKKEELYRKNFIAICSHINEEDFEEIRKEINKKEVYGIGIECIKYKSIQNPEKERPENLAIAKILKEMHRIELNLLEKMVTGKKLNSDSMLIIDGSLQFIEKNISDNLFEYVIGISKSFNPNKKCKVKGKDMHIASLLTKLEFGKRTPVFKQEIKGCNRIIGTWYVRIRPQDKMNNPLDGIIKLEKIAVTDDEKEIGFDSNIIDTISHAIICERNSTCHGKDARWCNHLYPVYLTEKMLKESFINEKIFLNLF